MSRENGETIARLHVRVPGVQRSPHPDPVGVSSGDQLREVMASSPRTNALRRAPISRVTLAIFIGLSLTVFITRKDFTFLSGALVIASFAALGVLLASVLFGFILGAVSAGAMVLLMAGCILFQTSLVLGKFPPTAHVAAALMLFSTIATLFWYVLQLLMSLRR
jgi:FtsH-binding integral membrane protein